MKEGKNFSRAGLKHVRDRIIRDETLRVRKQRDSYPILRSLDVIQEIIRSH